MSLTSCCCKVAERLLSEHIHDYLQQNDLLSAQQFGFRRGHSAEDQLLLTYSKIVAEVDDGSRLFYKLILIGKYWLVAIILANISEVVFICYIIPNFELKQAAKI